MDIDAVELRSVREPDLDLLRRFDTEVGLIGPNWYGFRDAGRQRRRFETDGFLGAEDGRLIVAVEDEVAGFVGWNPAGQGAGRYRSIGIALLPEWRGKGVGTRAQQLLCRYLFTHTTVHRLEAGTQPENEAEQRALRRIGFRQEGVLRGAEFRDGGWRDIVVFGLLRGEQPGE
ncbi:GNAT family protein [Actinoplanes sp. NPDC026623]|uniref:GNAT family N-acetyltransferase n=1 Tax=Actinoplanes sp. NPDC026623 TaxID=3155610 RepID=UPI0033D7CDBC